MSDTLLWIEGLDDEVVNRHIKAVLPQKNWEVVEFQGLDLFVIHVEYKKHSFNKLYVQYNYLSGKYRVIICPHQKDKMLELVGRLDEIDGIKIAKKMLANGRNILNAQNAIKQKATRIGKIIIRCEKITFFFSRLNPICTDRKMKDFLFI
jgi:hypothetical protein